MNNKLAMVAMAAVLALASVPTTNAAYGDMVSTGSSEWTVALVDIADVDGGTIYRHGAGTANNFFDDVFVLNTNGVAGINQYDLVVASAGYDGSAVGELIADDMDLLVDNEEETYAGIEVPTVDSNENDRWDEEDYAFLCSAGQTGLEATESLAAGEFCIALTDADDVSAGELVRTADNIIDDWEGDDSLGMAAATFCIFDADEDGDFQGEDDGDLAWVVDSADCNVAANGGVLPLYSIEAFGEGLNFGTITTDGSDAFTSTISTAFGPGPLDPACLDDSCGTFTVFRHGAGTANNFFDDVVIYDIDDGGDVTQFDQVLASSGYDGTEAGGVVADDMTLLIGDTEGDFLCDAVAAFCNTFVYDVNEDGKYNTDDAVVFCAAVLAFTEIFATEAAAEGDFCIYLVGYSDAAAGDFVRTGDDLIDDFGGPGEAFAGTPDGDDAQLVYFDNDNDGNFEADEDSDLSWVELTGAADGATLPRYSIELFGGDFGTQVGAEDAVIRIFEDLLVTGLDIFRHNAGTANNFFDDVFVLDLDGNGIDQFDFVLASEGYDGTEAGGLIEDGMTLLIGNGVADGAAVISVDIEEDGNPINEDDAVLVCDDAALQASDADDFCISVTDAAGLSPGELVRTSSEIMDDWEGQEDPQAAADVCYYDSDNDASGEFEGDEDLAWLAVLGCDDDDFVGLYWVELYGEFGSLGGGGDTGEDPDDTDTDSSSTSMTNTNQTVSTSSSTSGSEVVNPGQSSTVGGTTTGGGNDTPGFELIALVAALGVALILVRRKL